jgi:CheY-like chemotaxis protein/DNA-directed RNA polymerase subunit RPC12/RpoP
MKCPRCGKEMAAPPDTQGFVACPSCGARLLIQAQPAPAVQAADIHSLIAEIRALQRMQGEILQYQAQILALLKSAPPRLDESPSDSLAPSEPRPELDESPLEAAPPPLPRVRHRRKTVLIVDDDTETLRGAVAAMESAQIPLRTVADGSSALAAIAAQKPDVLVLELGLGEPMPGRDFVNHVKATMEWIDIPIVLHTRVAVQSQNEARTLHGADEVVLKGPGSPAALLNRVIYLFQNR